MCVQFDFGACLHYCATMLARYCAQNFRRPSSNFRRGHTDGRVPCGDLAGHNSTDTGCMWVFFPFSWKTYPQPPLSSSVGFVLPVGGLRSRTRGCRLRSAYAALSMSMYIHYFSTIACIDIPGYLVCDPPLICLQSAGLLGGIQVVLLYFLLALCATRARIPPIKTGFVYLLA